MILRRSRRSALAEPLTKTISWEAELKPVSVEGNELSNYQSIVRNDNGDVLAITKKTYHPATNEKFVEVVSRIHEFTGFEVEGYSVFQQGRKVLAFLKTERMKIGDFDSDNYMVLGNSFDCSTGFFTGISNVVIRCTNQFSRMNVSQNIRHNKQINMKLDELVRFYKDYMDHQNQLKKTFERWNDVLITPTTVNSFVDHVLDVPKEKISTLKMNNKTSLFHSINSEISAMGSTAYGLFNGLTHYTTHVVKSSNKIFGNSLGHAYQLNEKGFKYLQHLELH
jgi:hypothetical protein